MRYTISPDILPAFQKAERNSCFFAWLLEETSNGRRFEDVGMAVGLLHAASTESELTEDMCENILYEVGILNREDIQDPYNMPDYCRLAWLDVDIEKYAAEIVADYQYYLQECAEEGVSAA